MSKHIRWFYRLKANEEENDETKKAPALLSYEDFEPKTLIICQQVEKKRWSEENNRFEDALVRQYAKFNTYVDFSRFMLNDVKESHWCFYEIICGKLPHKLYFDIDFEISDEKEGRKVCLREEEIEEALKSVIQAIVKVCPSINYQQILLFTSKDESGKKRKGSYHIIVDEWAVIDYEDAKAFHDEVVKEIPDRFVDILDHGMYKSIQQFRIYRCHKFGDNRVKTLVSSIGEIQLWQPEVDDDPDYRFNIILGASLITNSSYCQLLPSFKKRVLKRVCFSDEIEISDELVEKALDLLAQNELQDSTVTHRNRNFPYSFDRTQGGLILLKRIRPSLCPICERVHENQHPFLILASNQNLYFHCRRVESEKKYLLGNLNPIPDLGIESEPSISEFLHSEKAKKVELPLDEPNLLPRMNRMTEEIALMKRKGKLPEGVPELNLSKFMYPDKIKDPQPVWQEYTKSPPKEPPLLTKSFSSEPSPHIKEPTPLTKSFSSEPSPPSLMSGPNRENLPKKRTLIQHK